MIPYVVAQGCAAPLLQKDPTIASLPQERSVSCLKQQPIQSVAPAIKYGSHRLVQVNLHTHIFSVGVRTSFTDIELLQVPFLASSSGFIGSIGIEKTTFTDVGELNHLIIVNAAQPKISVPEDDGLVKGAVQVAR